MAYIYMPLAFLLIGYAVIYLLTSPFIKSAVSLWKFMETKPSQSVTDEADGVFNGSKTTRGAIKSSEIKFPQYGEQYATVEIPAANINVPLFYGDGKAQLRKGAGQYMGSSFPGLGSTTLIAAHNHTFFHTIDGASIGDKITVTTNYGVFVYRIKDIRIKQNTDTTAYDLAADRENLVLYTCYPLSMMGLTPKRYFVYAEPISGPTILMDE